MSIANENYSQQIIGGVAMLSLSASFKNKSTRALAFLITSAVLPSSVLAADNQDGRYVKTEIPYNLPPGKREITIDCGTLVKTKSDKLAPQVAYFAQFNVEQDEKEVYRVQDMKKAERDKYLETLNAIQRAGIKNLLRLPKRSIATIFKAARDNRLIKGKEALAAMKNIIAHNKGAHGVPENIYREKAKLCHDYHGL